MEPSLAAQLRASSSTLTTLYSFGRRFDDGSVPESRLVVRGVSLFGTTSRGGRTTAECTSGCGTLFAVKGGRDERIIYRFKGGSDGAVPLASVIVLDGAFFGTTSGGGSKRCPGGCGTVFKVGASGKEDVVYRFKGGADGAQPVAALTVFDGALYGTTEFGGADRHACFQGCGTVFRLSSDGRSESTIYQFRGGADGAEPAADLVAVGGALYGTTRYGGALTSLCAIGCGTVFRVSKAGAERVLHRFAYRPNSDEGAFPDAGLVALGGALYGTTVGGGTEGDGTVFRTSASGAERTIYSFGCCGAMTDGRVPDAALIAVNGRLFGTTSSGGTGGYGTIFNITTGGAESVIYRFTGKPGGAHPQAALTDMDGALYGTTVDGGALGEGTVFRSTL